MIVSKSGFLPLLPLNSSKTVNFIKITLKPKDKIEVVTLPGRLMGRCYQIKVSKEVDYHDHLVLPVRNISALKFYVLGTNQESFITKLKPKLRKCIQH